MVSDLIDPGTISWKADLVLAGFNRDDVAPILSIPLSRTGGHDRLVWHYNVNGEYSVRSGYGVAVDLMENGALGRKGQGAPSERQKNNQVWNQIWKLNVPNKIKIFIWRCCNRAVAVRQNLHRRRMRVDNVCGVCGAAEETENHLFFQCEFRHLFWFCSPLHLNSHELIEADFLTNWELFHKSVKGRGEVDEILQEFAFGLWRLWKNRNETVFNGTQQQPLEVLNIWRSSLAEFREATTRMADGDRLLRDSGTLEVRRQGARWTKPEFGFIKVNTDAAWCMNTLRMGVGWVCRDFAGVLQATGGRGPDYATLLLREKPMPFERPFWLAYRWALTISSSNLMLWESNAAAHSVAKYVFKQGKEFIWDYIGPDFLFNTLAKDVNISIRI
ncbi:hypothetical protein COP2_035047 [Malus domestica]